MPVRGNPTLGDVAAKADMLAVSYSRCDGATGEADRAAQADIRAWPRCRR
jgi:hypothetical protein